jgi:hypothetical protein
MIDRKFYVKVIAESSRSPHLGRANAREVSTDCRLAGVLL